MNREMNDNLNDAEIIMQEVQRIQSIIQSYIELSKGGNHVAAFTSLLQGYSRLSCDLTSKASSIINNQ